MYIGVRYLYCAPALNISPIPTYRHFPFYTIMAQRELKFRAWTANCWINEGMVYDYQNTVHMESMGFWEWNSGSIFFMEFTGLKDKNGKEIYEGDIMCFEGYQGTKYEQRWVVELNPNTGFKSWSSTKNDEIVIGNIYENPELIQE